MARRRSKKRTHVKPELAFTKDNKPSTGASIKMPKNMVIRIGASDVGSSISQLATDVRRVMEPNTATRLKERRANRLRDYLTMAGPLGVTHLMLFSRSEAGNTNLRVAVTPRGPTLNFRVERYSLAKDVQKSQRHPLGGGSEYTAPPLLVMNNFSTAKDHEQKIPKHLESLTTTVFQSLFPPINPQTTPLKTIRRVLLLNREAAEDDDAFTLNLRHYAIVTKKAGLSRPLRRLRRAEKLLSSKSRKGGLPNLGKLEDIADFMIGGENGEGYVSDYTSGSEVETDAETDAEVEILDEAPRKVSLRARRAAAAAEEDEEDRVPTEESVEKRAVKLVELGPRLRLRLTKVEDGVCGGKVMWHEYFEKSKAEEEAMEAKWEKKREAKEERKRKQRENMEKKKKSKEERKAAKKEQGEEGESEESGDDEINYSDMDLDEYEKFKNGGDDDVEEEDGAMWEDEE